MERRLAAVECSVEDGKHVQNAAPTFDMAPAHAADAD